MVISGSPGRPVGKRNIGGGGGGGVRQTLTSQKGLGWVVGWFLRRLYKVHLTVDFDLISVA